MTADPSRRRAPASAAAPRPREVPDDPLADRVVVLLAANAFFVAASSRS
jgi:hypothetical protein